MIPDGSLNALNFEALLAPSPKPHYWIEDVTIANASSLRLLEHSRRNLGRKSARCCWSATRSRLEPKYAALPQAASEMDNIGKRFLLAISAFFARQTPPRPLIWTAIPNITTTFTLWRTAPPAD